MTKRMLACFFTCLLIFCCGFSVSAEDGLPTTSFTHYDQSDGTKSIVPIPDIYKVDDTVNARTLGLETGFEKIKDLVSDDDGNLYILSAESRVVKVGKDGKTVRQITVTDENNGSVGFEDAGGMYVAKDGTIYIADTVNGRVLVVNQDGGLDRIIACPDSPVIPDDFVFAPFAVEMDSKGVLYVLSDGAYYGALLFDTQDEFIGFYGANTVRGSALTTLGTIWDKLTKNDTKRKYSVKTLPYQFLDLYIGSDDFVYTCTGRTTSGASTGQLRMLSPSGTNILYKTNWNGTRSDAAGFNFGETKVELRNNKKVVQNFAAVQVDEYGYIYGLDNTYGLIYIYDTTCTLLGAFGGGRGAGTVEGVFSEAVDMCYINGKLYVADDVTGNITVFERTEFGNLLLSARYKTLTSHYADSEKEWNQVLAADAGNRLAYSGLARAAYWNEDYKLCMKYAKEAYDFVTYGQAKEKIGSAFIKSNFIWIFILAVGTVVGLIVFFWYTVRHKVVLIKNQSLRLLLGEFFHPFDTFHEIKDKKKGSLSISVAMLALLLITAVVRENYSNFRYTTFNSMTSNSLFQLLRTVGFALLAVIVNWGVCVLLEGKGKLKEVFITVCYSLLPIIIGNVLCTVASYLITSSDSTLISSINLVAWICSGIIVTVGLMVVHEYSFPKFLISVILTVCGMILVIFIIFMLCMLVNQLWSFLITLFMEGVYR